MQLAHAKIVRPKNTEFIWVRSWNNSTKLIRIEQILAIQATIMIKEYIVYAIIFWGSIFLYMQKIEWARKGTEGINIQTATGILKIEVENAAVTKYRQKYIHKHKLRLKALEKSL